MKEFLRRSCHLGLAVASALLLNVGPGLAQDMPVPCSAFARSADGKWKVLAPVVLFLDGKLLAPTVGTTFFAGSTVNGLKMSGVLDRKCTTGHPALSNVRYRSEY
jgi:hypothetical protein